ncbi:MAG: acetate--CoA ligase family protein [Sphingomonadales bacterium]
MTSNPFVGAGGPAEPGSLGIYWRARWAVMRGFASGVAQPAMLGEISVAVPGDVDFAAIDALMGPLFEEPLPPPPDRAGVPERMLHRVLHWHAAAQRQQKIPLFASPRTVLLPGDPPEGGRRFFAVLPYHEPAATMDALAWVANTLSARFGGPGPSPGAAQVGESFGRFMDGLKKYAMGGTNMFHMLRAAHDLDIPARPVLPGTYGIGCGVRSRLIRSTMTDRTSAMGARIARDKRDTALVLRQHGLPTPQHALVGSEDEALALAGRLGYPVVVKPADQDQGVGVAAGLRDAASVSAAYLEAARHSKNILVEKHHDGEDYRLTVFHDRVVKILRRRAGGVVGDGVHTIGELLAIEQETPRFRRRLRQTGKPLIEIDDEALSLLAERGLTPRSVPPQGERVPLRRKSNISTGGVQSLVRVEDAHPDNIDLAVRATRAVHLDLCGVDLITPDIARSWLDTGAVILELNFQPQIGVEHAPEVYRLIVGELAGGNGRIPVHLVICATEDDCPSLRDAIDIARRSRCNGLSMPGGVWVGGKRRTDRVRNSYEAARIVLADLEVEGAVCVVLAEDVASFGAPIDRCDSATALCHDGRTMEQKAKLAHALKMAGHGGAAIRSPAAAG